MNWRSTILRTIKRYFTTRLCKRNKKINNMRRRRESVASVYRKTTKFLTSNTANFLKKMPNTKKRQTITTIEDSNDNADDNVHKLDDVTDDDDDLGERDLDFYLGVRKRESYWRDPAGKEQIRKDYLVYHCGVTEDDYDKNYKKTVEAKVSLAIQPKFRQVPFKIHRKRRNGDLKDDSWREKSGIFKLFAYRRDSEISTSDSYSECDSNEEMKMYERYRSSNEGDIDDVIDYLNDLDTSSEDRCFEGVRIKEVSEGRPCDNCPELCPGFNPHAWRKTCKSCGCDRLKHSVYHEELGSVRDRLGLRESRVNHHSYDSPPGLTAKQTELYWTSLAERAPTGVGGATGAAAWRAWRTRALASQLPKQDLSLAHCRHIDEGHRKQYEDFVAARNEIALDIGVASQYHGASIECMGCNKPIRSGSITVQAPRIGEDAYFHPSCFSCADCDELLVELAYCALDGRLYCVRHYAERLKPRCHACDELWFLEDSKMGLLLSVVISYAGVNEAIECLKHILSGVVPETEPDFQDLVEYYTAQLRKSNNANPSNDDYKECGQGYLSLTEDKNGKLKSAAVKYYGSQTNSTAILFSTKISSFGQDSVDESDSQANGDYRTDRYIPQTKTILTNTSESINVGNRNRSSPENISDSNTVTSNSFKIDDDGEKNGAEEKLTWHYRPLSPTHTPQTLPEIHFQSFDDDKRGVYSEDFLRSLDGIKFRPLQRSDPSGRRRSFKKRHSSSSNSSKESRASREEELKMFTSLEEAEFERMNTDDKVEGFGSTPNLSARSYSRSRSRENSREGRRDHWSDTSAPVDTTSDVNAIKPLLKDVPKLNSFEEDTNETKEVIEEENEVDFWGNSGD